MRAIDRRTFLALGLGAAAWACTRGKPDAGETGPPDAKDINVVLGGTLLGVGDTRQAFVILRGQRPFAPKGLRARLAPPNGKPFGVEVDHEKVKRGLGGSSDHEHEAGTEVEDLFVIHHDFDDVGIWGIELDFEGLTGTGNFQVAPDTQDPKVGDTAIASKSPTKADKRGVNPICTRTPKCSMHDMTIAEALQRGKPTIIEFATPRFCTSRACGPVVDLIEEQKERVGDRASFVHIEVWKNDDDAVSKPNGYAPVFREWKLRGEPMTYFIDDKGVVRDRWMGPIGARELKRAVDALV